MKKLNLICASIAVLCAAAANAGTLSTANTVYAAENFGGSASASTQAAESITPGAAAYSMSTSTAINSGSSVYFVVRLTGGTFATAPVVADFQFAGAASPTNGTITIAGTSTDKTAVLVKVVATANISLGLGAFSYTPAAGEIAGVATSLATPGGTVGVSMAVTTTAPSSYESTDTLSTVDAPVATATLATSAAAESAAADSLASGTTKIDLTASPAGTAFTSGTAVALGGVTFTDNTKTPLPGQLGTGAAAYKLVAGSTNAVNTGLTVTVTPGAGQSFPVTSTLFVSTDPACGSVFGTSTTAAVTAAKASSAVKISTSAVAVVTGTEYYACLSAPTTAGITAGATITPITATLAGVVTPAATTDLIPTASGTGYALGYNGSTNTVSNYWPAALTTAYGYQGFVRIVNTGAVATVFNGQFINADGTTSTTAALTASVPSGGSVTLTSQQVEAALGAQALTARPRLQVSGATNTSTAQTFVQAPDGTFSTTGNQ